MGFGFLIGVGLGVGIGFVGGIVAQRSIGFHFCECFGNLIPRLWRFTRLPQPIIYSDNSTHLLGFWTASYRVQGYFKFCFYLI